jgi:FkbM family methyltransferase
VHVHGKTLAPSRIDTLLLWPSYRGKLRLARSLYGGLTFQGVAVTPLGAFEVDTADPEDWATLFGGKEQCELDWIREEFAGARLAFDVGAHHGVFTVVLARTVAKVVAVEPFAESAARIRRNLVANGLAAIVEEAGVSDQAGNGELLLSMDGPQNHSLVDPLHDSGRRRKVRLVTLDELASVHGTPDFVKIDVERGELEAFEGAAALLAERRTVFMFESAPWDARRPLVADLLVRSGYRLSALVRGRERPGTRALNLVARPR